MPLVPLPGTSDGKHWSFQDSMEPGQAIFAIAYFDGRVCELVGSGFYIFPNGAFLTAKHVAEESIERDLENVFIINLLPDNQYLLRGIGGFDLHPIADLAFGRPKIITDNRVGKEYRGKVIKINRNIPPPGAPVATWAHPRHSIDRNELGLSVSLEPDFYDGNIVEYHETVGPSFRLSPPYFRTNMHIHGGASGSPVFDSTGSAFALCSSSYDGATDLSFVTPLSLILDIPLKIEGAKIIEGSTFKDFAKMINYDF